MSGLYGSPRRPSLREQIAGAIERAQLLLQQLWRLASLEMKHTGVLVGTGLALFVIAVVGLVFAGLFFSLAAWWALGLLIGNAWSGLVIGGLWIVIAFVLSLIGVGRFKALNGFPETAAALHDLTEQLRGADADEPTNDRDKEDR